MLRGFRTLVHCVSMSVVYDHGGVGSPPLSRRDISEPSLAQCLSHHSTRADVIKRGDVQTGNKMADAGHVVLVTGGAGFLGQHVVKLLQEKASDVKEIRVFDIKPYTNQLGHQESKCITSIIGDVREVSDLSEAFQGVDAVIHTAGLVSFGTFPDYTAMEDINVQGTRNVIKACKENDVQRLVYTSTIDVVIGYDEILNGDETLVVPREFLFPGYPDTKYRAERSVLEANGALTANGSTLRTIALRPNVMYGEGDPFYVTSGLQGAMNNNGVLTRVGDGNALFQQAYVGNMAWGHVVANDALSRDRSVGGKAYFLTDDTPLMNTFSFMEIFLKSRGHSLSTYSLPYPLVYCVLFVAETFLRLISPIRTINTVTPLCSLIYVNKSFYFKRDRAAAMLGYKPLYDVKQSIAHSKKYYQNWAPNH